MVTLNKHYIGQRLLQRGFRVWFKYTFRIIEGVPFIEEPIHGDLFKEFDDIFNQSVIRSSISIPPRAGKTTLAKYFIAFVWAQIPKANFIYTSYSQSLLSDISRELVGILEHPWFKSNYNLTFKESEEEFDPIDDFWREYLMKNENKAKAVYSSKKIVTPAGGVALFSSIGSSITGFGAGIRGAQGFSGALIIDDANKPADIRSSIMRKKVTDYYDETLLSRLNGSDVAIVNIQQRLHLEDLTAYILQKYKFHLLKKPLMVDDMCQLPRQYDENRINEIKINTYMFQAQYQQNPINDGGTIIKTEWFKFYDRLPDKIEKIFITGDTAQKVKEHNDFSVFMVWAVSEKKLYLIDMLRGKWEAPELLEKARGLFNRFQTFNGRTCQGFHIEDKASGTGLIQQLKREGGIQVIPVQRSTDKLTRVEDGIPYIYRGDVFLPYDESYGQNREILAECAAFARDNSHAHDDIVDAMMDGIKIGIAAKRIVRIS